jgi:hypothetical protein
LNQFENLFRRQVVGNGFQHDCHIPAWVGGTWV